MTNLELIEKLKASTFMGEDGYQYQLEFQAGLSDAEIEQLKEKFPNKHIDSEIVEILKVTKGWDGYGPEMVYFDSIGAFGFEELSARSLILGDDGFGNHWILDLDQNGKAHKVFFACTDPAVFVVHSQNLNEYLQHLLEYHQAQETGHLNEIHEKTVMSIWKHNSLCSPKDEFESQNPEFKDFLQKFEGEDWTVADLRSENNKDGFAWGRFASNEFTVRHPTELVWVLKNKKKGFFSRLFGK